jgi:hypothetical protein
MDDTLSPSSVPSSEPSFDPSYVPSLKRISISSTIPRTAPILAQNELTILFVTAITFARHFNLLSSTEPSLILTVQSFLSCTVPSVESSLISTTVRSCPTESSLSSYIPSLESRSLSSSIPSPEPSFDPSYVPSLKRVPIPSPVPGTEPSFKPSTAPSPKLILFVSMLTFARHFNVLLSISEPGLEPSFISSEESHPTLKSNTVPSLEPSLRSNTALISPVPSSIPSRDIRPCLKSSVLMSSSHANATDTDVKSYFKDYYYRRSNVYNDSPSKAIIIFSSCHNLRLPVGMEIFILLLAAHNSEQSATPSSVPSAISSMEPSLKPSTALISARQMS